MLARYDENFQSDNENRLVFKIFQEAHDLRLFKVPYGKPVKMKLLATIVPPHWPTSFLVFGPSRFKYLT